MIGGRAPWVKSSLLYFWKLKSKARAQSDNSLISRKLHLYHKVCPYMEFWWLRVFCSTNGVIVFDMGPLIFLVPTFCKQFSMLYAIGYMPYLGNGPKWPKKWCKVVNLPQKPGKIRYLLIKMRTIRVGDPNVWQLLKNFRCPNQWNSFRGSQGHLKVIQGHFRSFYTILGLIVGLT